MNRRRTWGSTYPRFANRGTVAPHAPFSLTLPLNLLTLGLFTLVVNGMVLYLVAQATALEVHGFPGALIGALILSLVSLFLTWLLRD